MKDKETGWVAVDTAQFMGDPEATRILQEIEPLRAELKQHYGKVVVDEEVLQKRRKMARLILRLQELEDTKKN